MKIFNFFKKNKIKKCCYICENLDDIKGICNKRLLILFRGDIFYKSDCSDFEIKKLLKYK